MKNAATSSAGTVHLRYETIRNLTSPEEKANGAKSYFANVPFVELLKLDTASNLRGYIPAHPGKSRNQTHKAIGYTLENRSDRFVQLSSGITVCATDVEIDDNKKLVALTNGSILNGAQTQGEIRRFLDILSEQGRNAPEFHARVEFLVDPDNEFIIDAAIARNLSTQVKPISWAGKKQYFDDLNKSFQKVFPQKSLSTHETDVGDQFVDTLRLLQILWAMMPEAMLPLTRRSTSEARLKSYKNKAYCLVDFESDVVNRDRARKPDEDPADYEKVKAAAAERYRYFVDMAGIAWKEYQKWRHHELWNKKYLRSDAKQVQRDGKTLTVSDGVIFPILSAMSLFVTKDAKSGRFGLSVPSFFDEGEMVLAARDQLTGHKGDPMMMGRNPAAYEALGTLARVVLRFAERVGTTA
jgi:hypothetical protein